LKLFGSLTSVCHSCHLLWCLSKFSHCQGRALCPSSNLCLLPPKGPPPILCCLGAVRAEPQSDGAIRFYWAADLHNALQFNSLVAFSGLWWVKLNWETQGAVLIANEGKTVNGNLIFTHSRCWKINICLVENNKSINHAHISLQFVPWLFLLKAISFLH